MAALTLVHSSPTRKTTPARGLLVAVGATRGRKPVSMAGVRFADFIKTLGSGKAAA